MGSTVAIVCAIVIGVIAVPLAALIQDFLIKKEKIKADTIVRTEEVRAKNQLEIERLVHQSKSAASSTDQLNDMSFDRREVREKQR